MGAAWIRLVKETHETPWFLFKKKTFILNRIKSVQPACFMSMLSRMILSVSHRSVGILTTHFNRCLPLSHDPPSSFSLDTSAFGFHYTLKGNLSAHDLGSKDSCSCSVRNPITTPFMWDKIKFNSSSPNYKKGLLLIKVNQCLQIWFRFSMMHKVVIVHMFCLSWQTFSFQPLTFTGPSTAGLRTTCCIRLKCSALGDGGEQSFHQLLSSGAWPRLFR